MHRSTRRQFVDGVATGLLLAKQRAASAAMPLKAVVFDAFRFSIRAPLQPSPSGCYPVRARD